MSDDVRAAAESDDVIYVGIPWEHRPRSNWDFEEMRREFRERLHSLPCPLCQSQEPTNER